MRRGGKGEERGVVNGRFWVCSQNRVGAKRYLFDQIA